MRPSRKSGRCAQSSLGGAGETLIFLLGLGGNENPEGVNPERGAERDVQQADDAQDQDERPGPGFALEESPAARKAQNRLHSNQSTDDVHHALQKGADRESSIDTAESE